MNWFEELFGFTEADWASTRARFVVDGDRLLVSETGRAWRIGTLETPSLAELRTRVGMGGGTLHVDNLAGDVHRLHAEPAAGGALMQVASQCNLLEMVHYDVDPEAGITRYANDRTQGPACALAAAPATVYRNYFAPVAGQSGQTRERQLDTLADLAAALPGGGGLRMRNGYALVDEGALAAIDAALASADEAQRDAWRARLRIGLHWDVEVTAAGPARGQLVSQAFCSALPIRYHRHSQLGAWQRFATLVLEAAYEATLLGALHRAQRGGSPRVYLTLLGAGAFGNPREWVLAAMRRALQICRHCPLEVRIVSYGEVPHDLRELAAEFP